MSIHTNGDLVRALITTRADLHACAAQIDAIVECQNLESR